MNSIREYRASNGENLPRKYLVTWLIGSIYLYLLWSLDRV